MKLSEARALAFILKCKGAANFNSLVDEINGHLEDDALTEKLKTISEGNIFLNTQGLPETKGDVTAKISSLSERLYYYILRRYNMETLRGAELGFDSFRSFAKNYIQNLNEDNIIPGYKLFAKQLAYFEEANEDRGDPIVSFDTVNSKYFTDSYYKSSRVGYIYKALNNYPIFQKNDICGNDDYGIAESTLDAVVTDPPYGYGEGLDVELVKKIYSSLIEKSIKWLKPQGFLVFCALDKVKTGRTENLIFTEEILDIVNIIARKSNAKFLINDILLTSQHLKSVYYWKSKYALNRSIISLQILK